jgi:hypothetical protein
MLLITGETPKSVINNVAGSLVKKSLKLPVTISGTGELSVGGVV